jgi:hypothetical protein
VVLRSPFDLAQALERAARHKQPPRRGRKARSDRGVSRMDPRAQRALLALASGVEKPASSALVAEARALCERIGAAPPSRATIYNFIAGVRTPERLVADLPLAVQDALYNLERDSSVPESQIAFYCFNYGGLEAMSFAAGLPWLALYQAERMRGWRPKSRGALEAVVRARRARPRPTPPRG